MNIVFQLAYDGTRFVGWQKTNLDPLKFPSIEYELESVLEQILQHPVTLQAASRTDRGVHAVGQVVNFHTTKSEIDIALLQHSVNCLLPPDIRVLQVHVTQELFHPTLNSCGKEYHYRVSYAEILRPFHRFTHWHVPHALDLDAMRKAADLLIGRHDCNAFRNSRKGKGYADTIRMIHSIEIILEEEETLCIKMSADNFLYKMARTIAGTLIYVGRGKLQVADVASLLETGYRPDAGITAPACGLMLYKVFYPFTF